VAVTANALFPPALIQVNPRDTELSVVVTSERIMQLHESQVVSWAESAKTTLEFALIARRLLKLTQFIALYRLADSMER
jgi:hypothetical protein